MLFILKLVCSVAVASEQPWCVPENGALPPAEGEGVQSTLLQRQMDLAIAKGINKQENYQKFYVMRHCPGDPGRILDTSLTLGKLYRPWDIKTLDF